VPNVSDILAQARRRWVAARVVEWSAVAAIAAAAGALPVLAAWSVAYRFESLAVALCTLPLLAAVVVVVQPRVARASCPRVSRASRPRLGGELGVTPFGVQTHGTFGAGKMPASHVSPVPRWLVTGVLVSVFSGGLAGVLSGEYLHVPRAVWLLHVAVMAGVGTVAALAYRPDKLQTARMLDERLGLQERLGTAAVLLSNGCEDAMADAICTQAAVEAEARGVRTVPMWSRGRGTAGALCLTVLACLTLLLVPAYGPAGAAGRLGDLATRVGEMSPEQLQRLADELRNTAAADEAGTRQIHEAIAAAYAGDTKLLAQSLTVLARLIEEGKIRLVKLPPSLAEGTLRDELGGGEAGGGKTGGGELAHGNAANNAAGPSNPAGLLFGSDAVAADQTQLVFHSEYVKLTNPDTDTNSANPTAQPAATYISFDHAWDQARARASQALTNGEIPPSRRQAVREFFRTE